MSLEPGTTIASYTITREVGRGGMGIVYLAHDTRLDREVAVKSLPEEMAADPARLERFEREARTLASLNHPNLAGIYGIEEQDSARYLILEYVEGETIADILDRGALSVDDALELAVQICAGIEAAHEAGVIHRDLKPANIKVTPDGKAKVLDFGLARADESSTSSSSMNLSNSPTVTSPIQHSPTIPGAILGTAPYMSPEQARGRKVDKRTDIWSFAVVLYEMLTGIGPFHGETATDSIGAILHKDVDLAKLPPNTPSSVKRVLSRCLARDKAQRYRDIADVRIELQNANKEHSVDRAAPTGPNKFLLPIAILAALLAATAAWFLKPIPEAEPQEPSHLSFNIPDEYENVFWPQPRLSADGRRLIFLVLKGRDRTIVVRDLADPEIREIPTPSSNWNLAIAPDARWILYSDRNTLFRKLIEGGPSIKVCDVPSTRGHIFENADSIILAPERTGPLHRVATQGGTPEPLYELNSEEGISDRHPVMLPNGRAVLFHRCRGDGSTSDDSKLMALPLDTNTPIELVRGSSHGRYLNSGHLVYQRETSLFAVGFDQETLEILTPEVVVLEGLMEVTPSGPAQFDLSPNGTLVYFSSGGETPERRIVSIAFDGTVTPLSDHVADFAEAVPSDDGRFIALENNETGNSDWLSIVELERNLVSPLPTPPSGGDFCPVWSPDSRSIAFSASRSEHMSARQLYRFRVGSAAPPERIIAMDQFSEPSDWSADGRLIAATFQNADGSADIGLVRLDESGKVLSKEIEPLIEWPGWQASALFSPDDQWVLFTSWSQSSGPQVFVANVEDPTFSVQVSVEGATYGAWSPTSNTLYVVDDTAAPMHVYSVEFEIDDSGSFVPSAPEFLVELETIDDLSSFYVNKEGTGFIVGEPIDGSVAGLRRDPNVILNWTPAVEDAVSSSQRR